MLKIIQTNSFKAYKSSNSCLYIFKQGNRVQLSLANLFI